MAVRKPTPTNSPVATPKQSPTSSRNSPLSDEYDVKLIANTEHLRSLQGTPSQSRNGSTTAVPLFREGSRDGNLASSRPSGGPSGNFGSIRRAASVANPGPRKFVMASQPSIGLWAPAATEDESDASDDVVPNLSDVVDVVSPLFVKAGKTTEGLVGVTPTAELEKEGDIAPLGGLWVGSKAAEVHRGTTPDTIFTNPKRRWTVDESG